MGGGGGGVSVTQYPYAGGTLYGMAPRSPGYGRVMMVETRKGKYEIEECEFDRIYAAMNADGVFGREKNSSPLISPLTTGKPKMLLPGPSDPDGLKCADGSHFARTCPHPLYNASKILNQELGVGDLDDISKRWRTRL